MILINPLKNQEGQVIIKITIEHEVTHPITSKVTNTYQHSTQLEEHESGKDLVGQFMKLLTLCGYSFTSNCIDAVEELIACDDLEHRRVLGDLTHKEISQDQEDTLKYLDLDLLVKELTRRQDNEE